MSSIVSSLNTLTVALLTVFSKCTLRKEISILTLERKDRERSYETDQWGWENLKSRFMSILTDTYLSQFGSPDHFKSSLKLIFLNQLLMCNVTLICISQVLML